MSGIPSLVLKDVQRGWLLMMWCCQAPPWLRQAPAIRAARIATTQYDCLSKSILQELVIVKF